MHLLALQRALAWVQYEVIHGVRMESVDTTSHASMLATKWNFAVVISASCRFFQLTIGSLTKMVRSRHCIICQYIVTLFSQVEVQAFVDHQAHVRCMSRTLLWLSVCFILLWLLAHLHPLTYYFHCPQGSGSKIIILSCYIITVIVLWFVKHS